MCLGQLHWQLVIGIPYIICIIIAKQDQHWSLPSNGNAGVHSSCRWHVGRAATATALHLFWHWIHWSLHVSVMLSITPFTHAYHYIHAIWGMGLFLIISYTCFFNAKIEVDQEATTQIVNLIKQFLGDIRPFPPVTRNFLLAIWDPSHHKSSPGIMYPTTNIDKAQSGDGFYQSGSNGT